MLKAFSTVMAGALIGFKPSSAPQATSLAKYLAPYVRTFDSSKIEKAFSELGEKLSAAPRSQKLVPRLLKERVDFISKTILGRTDVVQVEANQGDHSKLHRGDRLVSIPFEIIENQSEDVLDMAIAHSLAHSIYESYIEHISPIGHSPHGHSSRKNEGSVSSKIETALAHTEIDFITAVILRKIGRNPLDLFQKLASDGHIQLKMAEALTGIRVEERTSLRVLPPEYRNLIQEIYLRAYSLSGSLQNLGEDT